MPIHKKSEGFILPLVAIFMVIISLILVSMLETESHYESLHTEFVHDQQRRIKASEIPSTSSETPHHAIRPVDVGVQHHASWG